MMSNRMVFADQPCISFNSFNTNCKFQLNNKTEQWTGSCNISHMFTGLIPLETQYYALLPEELKKYEKELYVFSWYHYGYTGGFRLDSSNESAFAEYRKENKQFFQLVA